MYSIKSFPVPQYLLITSQHLTNLTIGPFHRLSHCKFDSGFPTHLQLVHYSPSRSIQGPSYIFPNLMSPSTSSSRLSGPSYRVLFGPLRPSPVPTTLFHVV